MAKFPSKEYELIRRLQKCLPSVNPDRTSYETMIGDDAAIRVCKTAGERLIVTTDIFVENVHFTVDTMTFEEIGYRAMAANLSDCAAMGARPDSAAVQLVFPKTESCVYGGGDMKLLKDSSSVMGNGGCGDSIEKIYKGFARACEKYSFPIVGGDLSGGAVWTIGITLIGSVSPGERVVKRTGIADGDALWVTGLPGMSAAGLAALQHWGRGNIPEKYKRFIDAHITPVPRINEGRTFAACESVHAMMDLSDGLSKDVGTLCFDNNLGFVFDNGLEQGLTSRVSVMKNLADELGCGWKEWFYHGGEEYELLVSCAPSFDPRGIVNNGIYIIRLGHFTSQLSGIHTTGNGGTMEPLPPKSWDHCAS